MSFIQAAFAAVVAYLDWLIGLAVVVGAGAWVYRTQMTGADQVLVQGYDPAANTVELRELTQQDGGVTWEFSDEDRSDLLIVLDERYAVMGRNTGRRMYWANLENGHVFKPDFSEAVVGLDNETVITEEAHPHRPAVQRISGQKLERIRSALAPRQMSGNLNGPLDKLVQYAPYVLALFGLALLGIFYLLLQMPKSQAPAQGLFVLAALPARRWLA